MKSIKKVSYYTLVLFGTILLLFSNCEKEVKTGPLVVTTGGITEIKQTSATTGGNILNDKGLIITSRGVCWSTNDSPTINDNKTENGTGDGGFISHITGLEPNTTYYIRAYATSSEGTSYGSVKSFKTLVVAALATLTTSDAMEVTKTTARSGGFVINDGGTIVTARGVCWSTDQTPTIDDNKTENGSRVGRFESIISNLYPNKTYYVRAYATNSVGTAYGNTITFTTLKESKPTIETTEVTEIKETTATSGGNVIDEGTTSVVVRGVCWSTSESPTIDDNKTEDGSGDGSFTSLITGLEPRMTYYVRAYATNSEGTSYGKQLSFMTTIPQDGPGLTLTDIEGNKYNTVWINGYQWMAENLRTSTLNNGVPISNVTDGTAWGSLTTPGYAWYLNDEINHKIYGALYNWFAVNTGKLCPEGWHVSTDPEWDALITYLGGNNVITMGKLRETGTQHWDTTTEQVTNESGFTALPGGFRHITNGTFGRLGNMGLWWTPTSQNATNAYYRDIFIDRTVVGRYPAEKQRGFSIRCVRDN
ncbi:fibrobacter succinogenes major paralogous domain-containing protein [Petrimonas sp.]|uniref:fibrobacter succinogenes major paralogous domain-containing protein n=1 Tax=Petrimonas sp. TaxID=2023866 RepID=UPI002FCA2F38